MSLCLSRLRSQAHICTYTLSQGFYVMVFFSSTCLIWYVVWSIKKSNNDLFHRRRRGFTTRASVFMLLMTGTMFCVSTCLWVLKLMVARYIICADIAYAINEVVPSTELNKFIYSHAFEQGALIAAPHLSLVNASILFFIYCFWLHWLTNKLFFGAVLVLRSSSLTIRS